MLVCVTGEEEAKVTTGGETRVTLPTPTTDTLAAGAKSVTGAKGKGAKAVVAGPTTLTCAATTKPGGALLFRKDLTHEGLPVLSGAKEVISFNVWVTRKACSRVLLITFPAAEVKGASAAPLQALTDAPSYALSANAIRAFPTCMLNGVLSFKAHPAAAASDSVLEVRTSDSPPAQPQKRARTAPHAATKIVTYLCTDCSFDDFSLIYRVINSLYVRPCDVVAGADLLDYFGVPPEAVLVDCANAGNAGTAEGEGDGFATADTTPKTASKVASSSGSAAPVERPLPPLEKRSLGLTAQKGQSESGSVCGDGGEELADANIIICTSPQRTLVLAEAAKTLGLPFVRFDVLFAEGAISYGGR